MLATLFPACFTPQRACRRRLFTAAARAASHGLAPLPTPQDPAHSGSRSSSSSSPPMSVSGLFCSILSKQVLQNPMS